YGDAPRERLDLFPAADPKAPTLAFIHSGYWPMNDRRVSPFSPRACSKGGTSGSNPASSSSESCANPIPRCMRRVSPADGLGSRPAGSRACSSNLRTELSRLLNATPLAIRPTIYPAPPGDTVAVEDPVSIDVS